MNELRLPWIEATLLAPTIGAATLAFTRDRFQSRRLCVLFTGLTLILSVAAWGDAKGSLFGAKPAPGKTVDVAVSSDPIDQAGDPFDLSATLFGRRMFAIDELTAPMLPTMALLFFLTSYTTLKTKIRRFSFAWTLASETLLLAALSCSHEAPWLATGLLVASCVPPWFEIRSRGRSTRPYTLHMGAFAGLLVFGQAALTWLGPDHPWSAIGYVPLLAAVLIRTGAVPFHCWMADLFDKGTFGTALLFCAPNLGAFAALRLLYPVAPHWVMQAMGMLSIATALYAAGMSLVQTDARRFFCYVLSSHMALVMAGLEMDERLALTGALALWMSSALALCGFGLTLRAIEARRGRLSLTTFQGLYDHTPALAVCFLLMGLASVGFPGTIGFVGGELLVDHTVKETPTFGVLAVVATALNGIAVMRAYFLLFTGTRHRSSVSLAIGRRELIAVLSLATIVLVGGLAPQWSVDTQYEAAAHLLQLRERAGFLPTPRDQADADDPHDSSAAAAPSADRPNATR